MRESQLENRVGNVITRDENSRNNQDNKNFHEFLVNISVSGYKAFTLEIERSIFETEIML